MGSCLKRHIRNRSRQAAAPTRLALRITRDPSKDPSMYASEAGTDFLQAPGSSPVSWLWIHHCRLCYHDVIRQRRRKSLTLQYHVKYFNIYIYPLILEPCFFQVFIRKPGYYFNLRSKPGFVPNP